MTWDGGTPEDVFVEGYDRYTQQVVRAVELLAQRFAAEIEAWLKENAPWTDRTGNLRQSLYAEVETFVEEVIISFDYGLEYGFWLEFAHQGRYQIIGPALDTFGPKWVDALRELFA